jgi:riboflavin kinase/FMN adenylyltransferase
MDRTPGVQREPVSTPLEEKLADANPAGLPAVVAVGTFDGVHLGHRALLGRVRNEARRRGMVSIAVVFRQQPRSVIRPDVPFSYLCELDERLELLRGLGLDSIVVTDFDESVRYLTAEQFLSALQRTLKLKLLVLGPKARQGHDQLEAPALRALGRQLNFEVATVEPAALGDVQVSSTSIRKALAEGRAGAAAALLGRPFSLTGPVLPGDGRGRGLGFPTANLGPFAHATVPMDGIYATWAWLEGKRHMAATSVGVRPTFGQGNERRVEAYILDFAQDIYGRRLRLEFVERLRGELAFPGPELLVEQMKKDVAQTRDILGRQSRDSEARSTEGTQ